MGGTNVAPGLITLPANSFAAVGVPAGFEPGHRDQSFRVLLPPAQNQKVMIAGGGSPVTNKFHGIDLSVGAPAYTPVSPLPFSRLHALGVLLPDAPVLLTGRGGIGAD